VLALRDNEELYRDLVEHSLDLICTHDLSGVLLTVNLSAARSLGYEPGELVNRGLRELLSPNVHAELDAYLNTLKEKNSATGFIELWTKSGETRIWKYTSTLRTDGVRVPFVRAMANDLTDILQVQNALRESEARSRQIVQRSPMAMLVSRGLDQRCELVNDKFTALFGYSKEDVPSVAEWWPLAYPDEAYRERVRSEWQERVTEAIKNRSEIAPLEARVRCKDGSQRDIEFHFTSLGETDLVSFVDLTDRKTAMEVLAKLGGRLIEAQEEERTRLAWNLHEDICQQLASLGFELDKLGDIPLEPRTGIRKHIKELRKHLSQIVGDLGTISRELHSSKLELLGLKEAVRSLSRELSEFHKVRIDFVEEDAPNPLPNDISICLFRIAQEALRNGIKHSGADRFQVRLSGTLGAVHLSVCDDGVGFDPKAAMNRRGLGLISMRERINLLNGTMKITSKPQGGTEIRCSVPIAIEPPRLI
jgi:PAS domain S-box-containing protein